MQASLDHATFRGSYYRYCGLGDSVLRGLAVGLLVLLYAERGSPKYEKAALRWLERYLGEGTPRLQHFAEITTNLAKLKP